MNRNPMLVAILAALSGCSDSYDGEACMDVPATQTTCPARSEVDKSDLYVPANSLCGHNEIVEVTGDGKREDLPRGVVPDGFPSDPIPSCCYPAEIIHHDGPCATPGRPYFDAGEALLAPLRVSAESAGAGPPSQVAAAWARAGAAEHASVAAFSRLALELMALGAPNDLLRAVHQAALDEVGHADLCWAAAKRAGHSDVCAAEFPIRELKLASSLAALAGAAVREGCLAETLGAQVMIAVAALAPHPETKAVLGTIAREEASHAVLSFRIVAWALRVGGAEVKAAVRAALEAPWPALDLNELALRANVSPARVAEAAERARVDVLMPAARRLLAA
jgi:hypothetical protein